MCVDMAPCAHFQKFDFEIDFFKSSFDLDIFSSFGSVPFHP